MLVSMAWKRSDGCASAVIACANIRALFDVAGQVLRSNAKSGPSGRFHSLVEIILDPLETLLLARVDPRPNHGDSLISRFMALGNFQVGLGKVKNLSSQCQKQSEQIIFSAQKYLAENLDDCFIGLSLSRLCSYTYLHCIFAHRSYTLAVLAGSWLDIAVHVEGAVG